MKLTSVERKALEEKYTRYLSIQDEAISLLKDYIKSTEEEISKDKQAKLSACDYYLKRHLPLITIFYLIHNSDS